MMKKVLSIALALALCLTAMMGCFVVSADSANTLAVGSANITVGDAASVDVTLTSEGVWALRFDVVSDAAVTAVAISDPNFSADLEGTKVLIQSKDNAYATNLTNATITLSFGELAVGEYNVAIANIDAGNYAESAVAFDTTAGKIVVAEKVVEPIVDSAIQTSVNVLTQEKFGCRIGVRASTVESYARYDLVLTTKYYNIDTKMLEERVTTYKSEEKDSSSTSSADYYFFYDIAGYELDLDLVMLIECYDAEGNKVATSEVKTFNIAGNLKENIAKRVADGTALTTRKTLITAYVDILNYGAALQAFFAKEGSDLAKATPMNSGCEDYQSYGVQELPALTPEKTQVDKASSGIKSMVSVQVTSSNNIYYQFLLKGQNASDIELRTTHIDHINGETKNTYNFADMYDAESGRYILSYDKVGLYDAAAVVTADVVDTADNDKVLYTITYNIMSLISDKIDEAGYVDVCTTLAKCSAALNAHFA